VITLPLHAGGNGFAALWLEGAKTPTKIAAKTATAKVRRFQVVTGRAFFIMTSFSRVEIRSRDLPLLF
jgi:hypothetical protein